MVTPGFRTDKLVGGKIDGEWEKDALLCFGCKYPRFLYDKVDGFVGFEPGACGSALDYLFPFLFFVDAFHAALRRTCGWMLVIYDLFDLNLEAF